MLKNYFNGFRIALSGFQYLTKSGLRRYVFFPLLINISLFSGILWYGTSKISAWVDTLFASVPSWLQWLSFLLWPILFFAAMIIVFYTFALVANFIAAPFNGFYSEKIESLLTGNMPPSSGKTSTFVSIKDAFSSELKKLGYLITWAIPLVIFTLIPGVNIIMPFVWIVFGAWMLSLEYLDYPMGNHAIGFADQRSLIRRHRASALGFGTAIAIMTAVPILNFFAMPVAVAGATRLWVEKISQTGYLK